MRVEQAAPPVIVDQLPPLPGDLRILRAAILGPDIVAVSTADGFTPDHPYVLHDGATEWIRLTVH